MIKNANNIIVNYPEMYEYKAVKSFQMLVSRNVYWLDIPSSPSWLPYSADSCDLDLSVVFHDKYQWEIWKNTAGKSASAK